MYQYDGKRIIINNICYDFGHEIRTVLEHKGKYIILLAIPFDSEEINNIYCLDSNANLVWQVEDLSILYPSILNLAYEHIGIKDGAIFASDFYGRSYRINIASGKIESCSFVK